MKRRLGFGKMIAVDFSRRLLSFRLLPPLAFTGGAAGFLNLSQSGERVEPLRDDPVWINLAGVLADNGAVRVFHAPSGAPLAGSCARCSPASPCALR